MGKFSLKEVVFVCHPEKMVIKVGHVLGVRDYIDKETSYIVDISGEGITVPNAEWIILDPAKGLAEINKYAELLNDKLKKGNK